MSNQGECSAIGSGVGPCLQSRQQKGLPRETRVSRLLSSSSFHANDPGPGTSAHRVASDTDRGTNPHFSTKGSARPLHPGRESPRSGLVRPPPRFPERWTVTATALSPVTVTGAGAAAARFGLGCFGGVGGKRYKILHINDPERVFTGCVVATCSLPRGGKKKPCASVVFRARPRIQHS